MTILLFCFFLATLPLAMAEEALTLTCFLILSHTLSLAMAEEALTLTCFQYASDTCYEGVPVYAEVPLISDLETCQSICSQGYAGNHCNHR